MVQLNPAPVFGAQKNTITIWQKFSAARSSAIRLGEY